MTASPAIPAVTRRTSAVRASEEATTHPSDSTDANGVLAREAQLVALWLLGRVPAAPLAPWTLLRAGRAGRGPGPDVREMACVLPAGIVRAGDVEVHLRATDWARHGHAMDPAYANVVLHLVWIDDRVDHGAPQPLPGGGVARTIAVGPLLGHDPARLRTLLRRGPATTEPCADPTRVVRAAHVSELLRSAGQQRMAERVWHAARLVTEHGWAVTWSILLERALRGSAGRAHENPTTRAALAARIDGTLGTEPLQMLAALARAERPTALIEALRGDRRSPALGAGRAAEVGWNAVLPLISALAAAYDDVPLARSAAALAAAWPAPLPYGRTRALASLLRPTPGGGALLAQGLLHTQELWCERGGCGVCPFSAAGAAGGPLRPDDDRTRLPDPTLPAPRSSEREP